MEQIEFQEAGAVEFASPSTPGSKTKQYEISLHGQKELAQKLAHFGIINNNEYFPVKKSSITLMNQYALNSLSEIKAQLEIEITDLEHRFYNEYRLDIKAVNTGSSVIYSGQQNELLIRLLKYPSDSGTPVIISVFPLLTDVYNDLKETIKVNDFDLLISKGDQFALEIQKNDTIVSTSALYSY